jgi:dolichol kinase
MNVPAGYWQEVGRKTFHLLTLVYLAAYKLIPYPAVVAWAGVWLVLVGGFEFARLRSPALNRAFSLPFSAIMRPDERHARMTGIYYSAIGVFLTIACFGKRPIVVAAGLACLTFGDAAAAVVGRLLGRTRWPWAAKSVEGSAACLAACFAGALALGVPWLGALAAATAATVVEAAPVPFDDNLWIPVAGAAAASLLC